jgi:hypothetical protein
VRRERPERPPPADRERESAGGERADHEHEQREVRPASGPKPKPHDPRLRPTHVFGVAAIRMAPWMEHTVGITLGEILETISFRDRGESLCHHVASGTGGLGRAYKGA